MGKQGQRKQPTKKQFQEMLNRWDAAEQAKPGYRPFRNNQFHQRTRLYGDYLRAQDPAMFSVIYQEYLDGHWDDKFGPFKICRPLGSAEYFASMRPASQAA